MYAALGTFFLPVLLVLQLLGQNAIAAEASEPISSKSSAQAPAIPVVIKAGRLLDVENGQILRDQIVLIEGSKITNLGTNISVPSNAVIIDLSNKFVLPGLIDCHTHVTDPADADPIIELQKSAVDKAFDAIPGAKNTLMSGFTTIRDVGAYRALVDISIRDAIERGVIEGPRMFVAGAYLTTTGGGGALTGFAPDIQLPWDLRFGKADGPWEVRQRVRDLAHRGADFIKVIATGAVLTHGSNPSAVEFTPEELQAATDEAKNFGLKVAAHAHAAAGIKAAVRAGVSSIEHGTFLDAEGIDLMKQHGTYLVADIYNDDYIQGEGKAKGIPQDFLEHDSNLGQIQRDNFRKAAAAGVKMAFGTDAGVFPHGNNAKQFAYMVKYGLTPLQAIQSATINAAELIGKPAQFGSIKTGKFADIIAVDADPLQDIRTLEHVQFVMKNGHVYKSGSASGSPAFGIK